MIVVSNIKINSGKLEEMKNALNLIKGNIKPKLELIKTEFDKVSLYWEGPKADEFIEDITKFWNGGKDSNSTPILEKVDLEFKNLTDFIDKAIADTNATDVSVKASLETGIPATQPPNNSSEPESTPPSTETAKENDDIIDIAPPKNDATPNFMDLPSGKTSWKGYSNYRKVTDESTPAYAIVNGLTSPYGKYKGTTYNTHTDKETGVRYVSFDGDDTKYYCAALGTYYGEEGDTFKITTDKGNEFNIIMCDSKGADAEYYGSGRTYYHDKGIDGKEVVELYIDYCSDDIKVYNKKGKYIGTTGNYNDCDRFSGNVTSIEKLS